MALIYCPECGKQISDTCNNCIHCGYSLRNMQFYDGSSATLTPFKSGKNKKRCVILIVTIIAIVAVLIVLFVSGAFSSKSRDPFNGLYDGQTRESVHGMLGIPDRIKDKDPYEKYSWNIDEYYFFRFLGESGDLEIWYSDDNLVTHAWFEYNYPENPINPDAEPSSEERDKAQKYAMSIIEYYTNKYGAPSDGYYDYEWQLPDGSEIGLSFDLNADYPDSVIELKWG